MAAIEVDALRKVYRVPVRDPGFVATLKSLARRKKKDVVAVDSINFRIEPGEIVGFLGPNGAGKTSTLKMLTGLLHPTSGKVQVFGYVPYERKYPFLRRIALVMGQRNQLAWDIPAADSFSLHRAIYRLPQKDYETTLRELVDMLDIGELMQKPVRNLSLGERMKCEIAGALIHRPDVLFLDEPTLGLDVTAQRRIRAFIQDYNERHGATILLTSHYMADVQALARRVIIIHHGRLLYDGTLSGLTERFSPHKTLRVQLDHEVGPVKGFGEVVRQEGVQLEVRVPKNESAACTARLLRELPVADLVVEDPPIEEVIDQLFSQGNADPKKEEEAVGK